MTMQKQMLTMAMKAKLSTLWMFYLFNVRSFAISMNLLNLGFIEQVMTGTIQWLSNYRTTAAIWRFRRRSADLNGAVLSTPALRPQSLGQHHCCRDYPRV